MQLTDVFQSASFRLLLLSNVFLFLLVFGMSASGECFVIIVLLGRICCSIRILCLIIILCLIFVLDVMTFQLSIYNIYSLFCLENFHVRTASLCCVVLC